MVAYEELQGSPTESKDFSGFKATRKLMCAWSSRLLLAQQLTTGFGQPYTHFPTARVRRVSIGPLEAKQMGSGSIAAYEKAVLTVEYETPSAGTVEASDGDALVAERITAAGEFLTMPVEGFYGEPLLRWGSGTGTPLSPQEAPGRIIRLLEYTITRYQLDQIPSGTFSLVGTVNNASVSAVLLGQSFAAGTMLYNVPSLERTTTEQGVQKWNVTQTFGLNRHGWNKFWRHETESFEQIYHDEALGGGVMNPYELTDFSTLG